jgi:hypothetical protein
MQALHNLCSPVRPPPLPLPPELISSQIHATPLHQPAHICTRTRVAVPCYYGGMTALCFPPPHPTAAFNFPLIKRARGTEQSLSHGTRAATQHLSWVSANLPAITRHPLQSKVVSLGFFVKWLLHLHPRKKWCSQNPKPQDYSAMEREVVSSTK